MVDHAVDARRVAQLDGEPPNPRAEFEIAVAGPLTSVAAAIGFVGAAWGAAAMGVPATITAALLWVGVMNALLGVFNLLPGAPLDGGRVLRAVLWRVRGDRGRADQAAAQAGKVTGGVMIGLGVVALLAQGRWDGLWLAVVGWFLLQSAGAEQRASLVQGAAAGVVARDVMTPHPDTAPAWNSVRAFVENVAAQSRQIVFPVVGIGGEPQGVVTLDMLARVPTDRAEQRVGTIALGLPGEYLGTPDTPVASFLDRAPLAGVLVAVVVDTGVIAGIITVDDLRRLVQLRHLQRTDPATTIP